jgi:hypothetical protein
VAQPFKVESFVLGFCLLALGALWTLANFGTLDLLRTLRTYWPVSLIVWGVAEILNTFLAKETSR